MKNHSKLLQNSILILIASLVLVFITFVQAAEILPRDVTVSKKSLPKIKVYREHSRDALGKLDAMVNKTKQGEEYLSAQWQGICNNILTELELLKREGHISSSLDPWYGNELQAWQNVHEIGTVMMDHHYKMASTLNDIEDDIKDSEAVIKAWKERIKTINDIASGLIETNKQINELGADDFGDLKEPLSKYGGYLSKLDDHSQTISRLISSTRKVKIKFIKERDLAGPYKDTLNKLKSKALDPDQSGIFVEHEKRWEEVMFRTHARYSKAVENWKKVNKWVEKGQVFKIIKEYGPKLIQYSKMSFLDGQLIVLQYNYDEQLADWCLALRKKYIEILDKTRGQTWAKLEAQLLSIEEERQEANSACEKQIEKNKTQADLDHSKEEKRINKDIENLEKDIENLYKAAANGKVQDIVVEERKLQDKIDLKKRELSKSEDKHYKVWLKDEDDKAYKELVDTIKEIDKRKEDLEREQDETKA